MAETVRPNPVRRAFAAVAGNATKATGSVWGFGLAALVVLVWAASGPAFGFTDTWQLVINTGTTIVTFLMVFLIQHSQNKDTQALQLKLNELIAAVEGASNRLIDIEDLTEDELKRLHQRYQELAERVRRDHIEGPLSVEHDHETPHGTHDRKGETPTDHYLHR